MGDYPKCGSTDPGAVDSCPNSQCQTHPGGASVDSPPQPASQGPPTVVQWIAVALPRQSGTRWQTAAAIVTIAGFVITLFVLLKPGTPTVPVVGLVNEAAAFQQLKDAHYAPDVIRMEDDNIAAGLAIKTDPAGGTELKHGEHVKLYISAGPCKGPCAVEVPSVEGLPMNEALSKLQDNKFTVRINRATSERPVDQVIVSDPKATTLRPLGSEVVLTVSSGPQGASSPPGPQGPLLVLVPGPQGPLLAPGPQGPPPSSATLSPSPSLTPPPPIELPDLTTRDS